MSMPGGTELIIIALVVLLLFGGKKIPELAKGLGNGIKNFKKAIKEDDNEENQEIVKTEEKIEDKKVETKATEATSETKKTEASETKNV